MNDIVLTPSTCLWRYSGQAATGSSFYMNGQNDEALTQIEHTLTLAPGFAFALFFRGLARFVGGDMNAGIADVERAVKSGRQDFAGALGLMYGLSGAEQAAREVLAGIDAQGERIPPIAAALVNLGLNQFDNALAAFECCIEQRTWHVLLLFSDPMLLDLGKRREFQSVRQKLGLKL